MQIPVSLRSLFLALFLLGLGFLSAPSGLAQQSAPWMSEITQVPPGPHSKIRPVELTFKMGWKNKVNAGSFTITVNENGQGYIGSASGKTIGMARLLWPYDVKANALVGKGQLNPLSFQMAEELRSKRTSYQIQFQGTKQTTNYTETSKKKKDSGKSKSETYELNYSYGRDLLSSVFYLRSMPLNHGDKVTLLVTPTHKPYLARFQVTGHEQRTVNKKSYPTIRLNLDISKIRHDLTLEPYSKVKKITLWVTNDEYRVPLELKSELFVGSVTSRLESRRWLN